VIICERWFCRITIPLLPLMDQAISAKALHLLIEDQTQTCRKLVVAFFFEQAAFFGWEMAEGRASKGRPWPCRRNPGTLNPGWI